MSDKKKDGLQEVRDQINAVDTQILDLLAKRRSLSTTVIQKKDEAQAPIRDPKREEEILIERIRLGKSQGLDAHYVTKVFHEIIDDSIRMQQEYLQERANPQPKGNGVVRVAFHGIEGSYSYLAGKKYFSREKNDPIFSGHMTFEAVAKAVESGQADYAMLPIENTTSGGINEVYDQILRCSIAIIGEEKFPLNHCLIGSTPEVSVASIKKIYCSPNAVVECGKFLAQLAGCKIEYFNDSALSVKKIRDDRDPTQAAIASEEAARLFGLSVIQRDIANQRDNFNRYIVIARNPKKVDLRIPCKTSLVIATPQKAGALVEALLIFKENGINLTKLESRPIPNNPWEEMFYVDFEGNVDEERAKKALNELTRTTRFIKVLGCYPSHDLTPTAVSPQAVAGAAEMVQPAAKIAPEPEKLKTGKKSKLLSSRDQKESDTVIEVKGLKIGGENPFVVMAGPCSVESQEQIINCAREAREHGALVLRGGCFKPRTSPYSFQGLGFPGLDLLADAGKMFGLPIITEVMSPEDVERVAEKSDILQIGARNMQNFTLLKAVGRTHRPVMLKRGMSSSLEELLQATEYILSEGNQQVMLCERGIRTFETATRNTLDLSAVPVLRRITHLPVIVDPSHAAGERDLVPPLSRASKAVGAHGIIIEFHPEPEKALSDGPQALRFHQFESLMAELLRN